MIKKNQMIKKVKIKSKKYKLIIKLKRLSYKIKINLNKLITILIISIKLLNHHLLKNQFKNLKCNPQYSSKKRNLNCKFI